jgi:hypothetical protein
MTVKKRSVALDDEVADAVVRAAGEDNVSVSAWLSQAAKERLRIRRGLSGVSAWEARAGRLSPEEIAAGEALLDRLLAAKTMKTATRRRAG